MLVYCIGCSLSSTLLEALETALDALGALVIFVPDSRVAMVSALISAAVWELALASRPANRNSFRIMSSNVSFDGLHTCLFDGFVWQAVPATGGLIG